MQLLFDEMLMKTAKWARIFGVDSLFARGSDDEILLLAKKSGKILVTRDAQLSLRAKKQNLQCIFIVSTDVAEQLAEIEVATGKHIFKFPEETRCPKCNGELFLAEKDAVKDKVPESVYQMQKKFWLCKNCGKIYWEGGHWKNITRIYKKLEEKRKN
ncbi:MAG: Mut7-C RNAse domain-containing protein [Candidatus Micrarchaeota archaeon]